MPILKTVDPELQVELLVHPSDEGLLGSSSRLRRSRYLVRPCGLALPVAGSSCPANEAPSYRCTIVTQVSYLKQKVGGPLDRGTPPIGVGTRATSMRHYTTKLPNAWPSKLRPPRAGIMPPKGNYATGTGPGHWVQCKSFWRLRVFPLRPNPPRDASRVVRPRSLPWQSPAWVLTPRGSRRHHHENTADKARCAFYDATR